MTSSTLAGGSIRILWDEDDSAEVTITGSNASFTVSGVPVTFPYTLTSSTTFATTQSGEYTISVLHYGYEIAGTPDGTRRVALRFGEEEIFAPSPDSRGAGDGFGAMVRDVVTTDVPDDGTDIGAALAATFAKNPGSLLPRITSATVVTETSSTPRAMDYHGGYFWGATSDNKLWKSADGDTWTQVATPPQRWQRLLPTADGEMVATIGSQLYKSSGWTTNPATATWVLKQTTTDGINGFPVFGLDSNEDGSKFIAIEYGSDRTKSNKVYMSLDSGTTWATVYDTQIEWPADYANTHVHCCCYDRWADRWWFSQGHDNPRGLYYSDDDGDTWTRLTSDVLNPDGSPLVMVATKQGIVCGSDSNEAALFLIPRDEDPSRMRLQILNRWRGANLGGVPGTAIRGFTDPATGLVWMIYSNSADTTYPASLWVTDGMAAREVYLATTPGVALQGQASNVAVHDGVVRASWLIGATNTLVNAVASAPYPLEAVANDGNMGGGVSTDQSSIAVGPRATATSSHGTVMGTNAKAGINSTAIGSAASADIDDAVAIGKSALVSASDGVAIGQSAVASTPYGVAIGSSADATANSGVALGRDAQAAANDTVALGKSATANHTRSFALGAVTTTATDQVKVGTKHYEFDELAADPAAPAADRLRLYAMDDAGATKAKFRTAAGTYVVATTADIDAAVAGVVAGPGSLLYTVAKAAADTVNNTTTLVADSELHLDLDPGTYLLSSLLIYDSSTTADFRFQFTLPSGATLRGVPNSPQLSTTSATNTAMSRTPIIDNTVHTCGAVGVGTPITASPGGRLVVPSAGTLTLKFAQGTAEATVTTLQAGSWLAIQSQVA